MAALCNFVYFVMYSTRHANGNSGNFENLPVMADAFGWSCANFYIFIGKSAV